MQDIDQPSAPVLIARASATLWQEPTGLEAHQSDKELCPVGNHAIKEIWEDTLAFKIHDVLESMKVQWTSINVVRIGNAGDYFAPVVLSISVTSASLSGHDSLVVASKCRNVLVEHSITDVDVEIREAEVWGTASSLNRSRSPTRPALL
ncbi:uncharacterized protein FOMMEDRAFT_28427 [Fomitiporia mediterranea MF3/22]|uniref:uncharacterized protein n=1 Tax=Fomitiporia mediterranea (strain MF3/22) TaxID=694068 RepID=UPI00044094D0|nr:uncharacterized protein FOMMEDRAFT_28427 [Fomitiporia mediterranea MF3/22]EJD02735.1 hypothetical protein FOMMEDRAFT_28427 [Fomitiporia mediterranea MF3/22]